MNEATTTSTPLHGGGRQSSPSHCSIRNCWSECHAMPNGTGTQLAAPSTDGQQHKWSTFDKHSAAARPIRPTRRTVPRQEKHGDGAMPPPSTPHDRGQRPRGRTANRRCSWASGSESSGGRESVGCRCGTRPAGRGVNDGGWTWALAGACPQTVAPELADSVRAPCAFAA